MAKNKEGQKKIFICSPLSGDIEGNIIKARAYCKIVSDLGHIPICPHIYFTQFLDDNVEKERNTGIDGGIKLMDLCDEMWVFGDTISAGMRKEIDYWNNKNNQTRATNTPIVLERKKLKGYVKKALRV